MDKYRKRYRRIFILASMIAAALFALPVMSVCLNEGESCALLVRGYNLMEFSAWGCVPLLAPLLIPVVVLGGQTLAVQETELLLLPVGNMVCYVHSLNAARTWLNSLGGSLITYHLGIFLIPVAFLMILMFPKIFWWVIYRKPLIFVRNDMGDDEDEEDLPF